MKKLVLVAGLVALWIAQPASANSSSFRGVVIATQPSRHVLVVAGASGAVRTISAPRSLRVGSVVVTTGRQIAVVGQSDHALFRGVVVRSAGSVTFFAAGRSIVAAHSSTKVRSAASTPGTIANVSVAIGSHGTLTTTSIVSLGQTNQLTVEATVVAVTPATATTAGSLTLLVNGQTLTIALTPGTVLPANVVPNATVNLTINLGPTGPSAQSGTSAQGDDSQGDDNDDQSD